MEEEKHERFINTIRVPRQLTKSESRNIIEWAIDNKIIESRQELMNISTKDVKQILNKKQILSLKRSAKPL